ncbi:MAG: DUF1987 domain-containing protein [Tunicatimonas sp.]
MTGLFIPRTSKTPDIAFDADQGYLELKGRSIPEDSVAFYAPLMQWIDAYEKHPQPVTKLVVRLEYFNTSSSKCLIDIFRKLEKLHRQHSKVSVVWYYEEVDEDMKESGEDFRDLVSMPVIITPLASEE